LEFKSLTPADNESTHSKFHANSRANPESQPTNSA
jgi:hypothetical protein